MVFSIRVKRPESVAGRVWNLAQDGCGAAVVVLVVLKLTGVVTWSWWRVLSPLWLGGILLAVVLCGLLALLLLGLGDRVGRRRLVGHRAGPVVAVAGSGSGGAHFLVAVTPS